MKGVDLISLKDVFRAYNRIYQFVWKTPLIFSDYLSKIVNREVFLKLENYQVTGSFKVRGAFNKMLKYIEAVQRNGVITASMGNHGLAVAYAAKILKVNAHVVVPRNAPKSKIEKMRIFNSRIIFHGENYDDAEVYARKLAVDKNLMYISPYNDLDVIEGNATIGLEIMLQNPEIDFFIVPVGGGGLISGISLFLKMTNPEVRIIGAQSDASPAMYESLRQGRIVKVPLRPSIADGLHGNIEENSITFDFVRKYVDDIVLVTEEEIRKAIKLLYEKVGILVEGSAAVTVAALLKYKDMIRGKTCLILSGGNVDPSLLASIIGRE